MTRMNANEDYAIYIPTPRIVTKCHITPKGGYVTHDKYIGYQ